MKLVSKLAPAFLVASLMLGSAMTVFAAPSATAVPDLSHNDQYEVTDLKSSLSYEELYNNNQVACKAIEEVNESKDKSTKTFVQNILKDTNEKTKASAEKIKDIIANSDFLTGFFDIHVQDKEMMKSDELKKLDLKKSDSGFFEVTLEVPSLTKNNKKPYVLHFSQERQEWEILWPTAIDYEKKTLTVEFKDFSPASILTVANAGEEAPVEEEPEELTDDTSKDTPDSSKTTADNDDDDDDSHSSSKKSSGAKSPKTGVADTWILWLGASAVLAGVARKRH